MGPIERPSHVGSTRKTEERPVDILALREVKAKICLRAGTRHGPQLAIRAMQFATERGTARWLSRSAGSRPSQ